MKNTNLMGAIEELPREALAARPREIMPGIDLRIREGVRHKAIVATLNAKGFALSLGAFRKILYRWRKTVRAPISSAAEAPGPVRSPRAKPFGISEAFAAKPADTHPRARSAPSRAGLAADDRAGGATAAFKGENPRRESLDGVWRLRAGRPRLKRGRC